MGIPVLVTEEINHPRVLTHPFPMCEHTRTVTKRTKIIISTDGLLSVPQAAKELGVHFTTLYRWINKGIIRPFRIGSQVFLTVDELETLKKRKTGE